MEVPDILGTAAGGAGGVLTMGVLAKILIQNWIKNQEKHADQTRDELKTTTEKNNQALQDIAVALGQIGVKLENLQRTADMTVKYGEAIAVLQVRTEDFGRNLNGLGQKVKRMEMEQT